MFLLLQMDCASAEEIKFLVKKMICSNFYPEGYMSREYRKIYDDKVKVEFEITKRSMRFGLTELNGPRLLRRRLTASSAFKILHDYEIFKYDEEEMENLIKQQFIRKNYYRNGPPSVPEGIKREQQALATFSSVENVEIKSLIDIIHPQYSFLIAQTDGIIVRNGVVESLIEVKSPDMAVNEELSIIEFFNKKKPFDLRFNKYTKTFFIYEESNVYYQVQLCLGILNLDKGIVIFFSAYDNSYIKVEIKKNDSFIREHLLKLKEIHSKFVIPLLKKHLY